MRKSGHLNSSHYGIAVIFEHLFSGENAHEKCHLMTFDVNFNQNDACTSRLFLTKSVKVRHPKTAKCYKKHLEKSKSTKFMLQDYKFSYDYLSGIGEQKIASSAHCNECLRVIQDF